MPGHINHSARLQQHKEKTIESERQNESRSIFCELAKNNAKAATNKMNNGKKQQRGRKNNVNAALNALFPWLLESFRFRHRLIVK